MKKNKLTHTGNNDLIDNAFYPFLNKIAEYIPASITPNQLSVVGFIFALLNAVTLITVKNNISLFIASFCLFIYWAFDCLDGIHARRTHQTSILGDFTDHFLDTLSTGLILFAILFHFNLMTPLYLASAILIMTQQTATFLCRCYTQTLYLAPFGPSCLLFLTIFIYIITFFWGPKILEIAMLSNLLTAPLSLLSLFKQTRDIILAKN
ncbi:MAG: CDP-alcohol phosphatidyltransferase family protein [Bacteroidia bacterium]